MINGKSCVQCTFYRIFPVDKNLQKQSGCVRFPPIVSHILVPSHGGFQIAAATAYPQVNENTFPCGEFKMIDVAGSKSP